MLPRNSDMDLDPQKDGSNSEPPRERLQPGR